MTPFHEHLDELRGRVARMAGVVQQQVEQAVEASSGADVGLARNVIRNDEEVDRAEVEIERMAIDLLALYQPAASDLRLVTNVIKVNGDFERISDCAVNVAQHVHRLAADYPYQQPADLRLIGQSTISMLRDTTRAFNLADVDAAHQVLRNDDLVDALYAQIVQDAISSMETEPKVVQRDLTHIMIAKNLERIGDHCTSIAEDIIYVRSGEIVRHRHAV